MPTTSGQTSRSPNHSPTSRRTMSSPRTTQASPASRRCRAAGLSISRGEMVTATGAGSSLIAQARR